jgi:hypothetical protein
MLSSFPRSARNHIIQSDGGLLIRNQTTRAANEDRHIHRILVLDGVFALIRLDYPNIEPNLAKVVADFHENLLPYQFHALSPVLPRRGLPVPVQALADRARAGSPPPSVVLLFERVGQP